MTRTMTAAEYCALPKEKPSKYRNRPIIVNGVRFASRKEAKRWQELRLLEVGGEIEDLKRQVPIDIKVNGTKVGRYIADFVYSEGQRRVVEDAKGFATPEFRLKWAVLKALHPGIEWRLS